MTSLASVTSPGIADLHAAAAAAGLTVLSSASWPAEGAADGGGSAERRGRDQQRGGRDKPGEVPALAGFIDSNFSPLLAHVAERALRSRPRPPAPGTVTAIVMVTALGDVTSATRVAAAVDAGQRVPPLQFFQSVPNAVAGYLAARWQLSGPVVCVSGTRAGRDVAALLIEDADAHEVLVVRVDLAVTDGGADRAAAILVTGPAGRELHRTADPDGERKR